MQGWVGKTEEMRLKHIGKDNTKICIQEIVWIILAQERDI